MRQTTQAPSRPEATTTAANQGRPIRCQDDKETMVSIIVVASHLTFKGRDR